MKNEKRNSFELLRKSVNEIKIEPKNNISIVLDNVRSAQNVGSFFRTCDAFNVDKIYLCGITATPPNKEIFKTALGSTESVDWQYFETTIECIEFLKLNKFRVYGVEQTIKSIMLNNVEFDFDKINCFVFGNEVEGISAEVINLVDSCIEIPQFGTKHSLNVSVSGGIVLWDFISKMITQKI